MERPSDIEVLRLAASSARQAFDLRAAFLTLPGPLGATIAIRDGLSDPRWEHVVVRPYRGLGGRVLVEGDPLVLDDYLTDSSITGDYRPIVRAEGLSSITCVPVRVHGRVESLLYLAAHEPGGITDRLVDAACGLAALLAVALGELHDRDALAGRARHALRTQDDDRLRSVVSAAARQAAPPPRLLTDRERDVLDLLADGASNATIARCLFISEGTAKEHVRNLRRKLGAGSRLDAVARARDVGLV